MINIIHELFDSNTFAETNAYIVSNFETDGKKGDGVITGYGSVNDRAVFAAFQDETYLKGAVGFTHAKKISDCINMAVKNAKPFIFYMASAGARINEGLDALNGYGMIVKAITDAIGIIPIIAVIDGDCTGISSVIASLADFAIATKNAYISFAGKDSLSSECSKDFKSSKIISNICETRTDAFNKVFEILQYIPDSFETRSLEKESNDDLNRPIDADKFKLNTSYDVRELIKLIADDSNITEVYNLYSDKIITAFAFVGEKAVCIIANQTLENTSSLDSNACDKISSMIAFCDKFHIPVITLINTDGFVNSKEQENIGLSISIAGVVSSFANSEIPKINIITGKAYGSSYIILNGKNTADIVYAWKDSDISVITPEAGALLVYNEEIKSSADPISARKEYIQKYKNEYSSPYYAAVKGLVDDIINPNETRARIISALYLLD